MWVEIMKTKYTSHGLDFIKNMSCSSFNTALSRNSKTKLIMYMYDDTNSLGIMRRDYFEAQGKKACQQRR